MTQHLLITVAAPPLFVIARTGRLLAGGLPTWARRSVAPLQMRGAAIGRRLRRYLPVPVTLLAVSTLWAWHLPVAYDAAVERAPLHGIEHMSLFGTALAFWWLVLDRRSSATSALISVVIYVVAAGAIGSMLTFAPRPLYDAYATRTDALADQQLAGLLMWIPGGLPLLVTAVAITVRALSRDERRHAESVAPVHGVPS